MTSNSGIAAVPDDTREILLGDGTDVQSQLGPVAKFSAIGEKTNIELDEFNGYKTAKPSNEFVGLTKEELKSYINSPKWKRIRWIISIIYLLLIAALLVASVFLVWRSPRCPPKPKLNWYQKEIIYEVDLTTFRDSDQDGIGDIKGLMEKFAYLEKNRIKSVLLQSTIFNFTIGTSVKLDGTHLNDKKIDLLRIDPKVGTDADLQDLFKAFYRKDMHLIIDLPVASTFDPNGQLWYGSSTPLAETIRNPCATDSSGLACRYYRVYGRLPLDMSNEDIANQAEVAIQHWLSTKKVDGVRVDLPIQFNRSAGRHEISYGTIDRWERVKREIEKNSKPKLLLIDIPSELHDLITSNVLQSKTSHPVILSNDQTTSPITALELETRFTSEELSKPQFWKLGSKRRSDDVGITSARRLSKEMILTTMMLIGGTPILLYGDELGLDQKSNPLMPWTSDPPYGGFTVCPSTSDDCNRRLESYQYKPSKISVKRQEAMGSSKDSLLNFYRRLATLREQESFQYGLLDVGHDPQSNFFWFIREASGHQGYAILFNLHRNETAHLSLYDLSNQNVPEHVHYEYQWPKVNFPTSNATYIQSDNLLIDPQSINIFWWKAKARKPANLFGKTKQHNHNH